MIYDAQTRKALLARFTSSEQMIADNIGSTTRQLEEYYRTKTYVKPRDMLRPTYPPFHQPYQLAQDLYGGTWADYNEAFIVQLGKCNLDCWYCYVDRRLRAGSEFDEDTGARLGDWFTASEVKALFDQSGRKVLRVSGGEPLLAPEWVVDMMEEMEHEDALLWIDTNLVGNWRFIDMLRERRPEAHQQNTVGICGCFKGFTAGDAAWMTEVSGGVLDTQFTTARKIVTETELQAFFYVPGIMLPDTTERHIRQFFERMVEEVDPISPLRTYILQIHNYSSTKSQGWDRCRECFPETGRRPIDVWQELCEEYFNPEQLWMPQHQIEFLGRSER